MPRFSTTVAWGLQDQGLVEIGNKNEWQYSGQDRGRATWVRNSNSPDAEKADPGRDHYCCEGQHIAFVVRQGPKNNWCFAKHPGETGNHTDCELLREIGRLGPKSSESERHRVAKLIIYRHLRDQSGREKYNVSEVFCEKEIRREGFNIKPDIRVIHRNQNWKWGGETFIEIVNTSAPHKSHNQWSFYKDKSSLVVIDVKSNQRGWTYDFEYLPKVLLNKLERFFFKRDNAPKLYEDAYKNSVSVEGDNWRADFPEKTFETILDFLDQLDQSYNLSPHKRARIAAEADQKRSGESYEVYINRKVEEAQKHKRINMASLKSTPPFGNFLIFVEKSKFLSYSPSELARNSRKMVESVFGDMQTFHADCSKINEKISTFKHLRKPELVELAKKQGVNYQGIRIQIIARLLSSP